MFAERRHLLFGTELLENRGLDLRICLVSPIHTGSLINSTERQKALFLAVWPYPKTVFCAEMLSFPVAY